MDGPVAHRTNGFDLAITFGLGLLAWLSLAIGGDSLIAGDEVADDPRVLGIPLVVATIAPLAVRRRYPISVLVVCTVAFTGVRLVALPEMSATALSLFLAW